jgi:hypothetical protein
MHAQSFVTASETSENTCTSLHVTIETNCLALTRSLNVSCVAAPERVSNTFSGTLILNESLSSAREAEKR